jgi:uncharacterized membrane protein
VVLYPLVYDFAVAVEGLGFVGLLSQDLVVKRVLLPRVPFNLCLHLSFVFLQNLVFFFDPQQFFESTVQALLLETLAGRQLFHFGKVVQSEDSTYLSEPHFPELF